MGELSENVGLAGVECGLIQVAELEILPPGLKDPGAAEGVPQHRLGWQEGGGPYRQQQVEAGAGEEAGQHQGNQDVHPTWRI